MKRPGSEWGFEPIDLWGGVEKTCIRRKKRKETRKEKKKEKKGKRKKKRRKRFSRKNRIVTDFAQEGVGFRGIIGNYRVARSMIREGRGPPKNTESVYGSLIDSGPLMDYLGSSNHGAMRIMGMIYKEGRDDPFWTCGARRSGLAFAIKRPFIRTTITIADGFGDISWIREGKATDACVFFYDCHWCFSCCCLSLRWKSAT